MKQKYIILLTILIVIAVTGIITILTNFQKPIDKPDITWKNWSSIKSEDDCISHGGRWRTWGFWQGGKKECDMPYLDGGKICDDSSDCESDKCLFTGEKPIINASANGECAKWISTSCVNHHYFIKNGKIIKEICVE